MSQNKHRIVPSTATKKSGSSGAGYTRVTDDLKHGKVITEQYIPIGKQVTKDYQSGKEVTTELARKTTVTKDYKHGILTSKDSKLAKTVTEDKKKGIKTTEKHESTRTTATDCRTTGHVITKVSHHDSKEIYPLKTTKHLTNGKAR